MAAKVNDSAMPREVWHAAYVEAEAVAEREAPLPTLPAGVVAFIGVFVGYLPVYLLLNVSALFGWAGLNPESTSFEKPAILAAAAVAAIGFFATRSKRKAHYAVFHRVFDGRFHEWLREQEQNSREV